MPCTTKFLVSWLPFIPSTHISTYFSCLLLYPCVETVLLAMTNDLVIVRIPIHYGNALLPWPLWLLPTFVPYFSHCSSSISRDSLSTSFLPEHSISQAFALFLPLPGNPFQPMTSNITSLMISDKITSLDALSEHFPMFKGFPRVFYQHFQAEHTVTMAHPKLFYIHSLLMASMSMLPSPLTPFRVSPSVYLSSNFSEAPALKFCFRLI